MFPLAVETIFSDGGANTDFLNGESGIDTCVNGETLASCEIF